MKLILLFAEINYIKDIAKNLKPKFSSYEINSIRFELFNMYFISKYEQFERFDSIIRFLYEFNTHFPAVIPEILFIRVSSSLKALVIILYDLSQNNKYSLNPTINF